MYTDLIQNIVLMVALTTLYSLMPRLLGHGKTRGKILSGVLFGGVAVIGMQLPFHYAPGVIYDGRSIILALAGLFGGGMTAAVSAVMASAYRAYLGGAGIWAGLATIIACAGIGLVFRQVYGNRPFLIIWLWHQRSCRHACLPTVDPAMAVRPCRDQSDLAAGFTHLSDGHRAHGVFTGNR